MPRFDDDDYEIDPATGQRILRDGARLRVGMSMMDGGDPDAMRALAIASSFQDGDIVEDELDADDEAFLREVEMQKLINDRAIAQQRAREQYDAEISAAWKGGLDTGDTFQLDGKTMVVTSNDGRKATMRDASTFDAREVKQDAYDSYDDNLSNAWRGEDAALNMGKFAPKPGDSCQINGAPGRYCLEGGRVVCRPLQTAQREPSDQEWEMGGPLSDSASRQQIYDQYDADLSNAWKHNK